MFVIQRGAWWLLVLSAVILEITALWFQYSMGLDPCVKCVYQRVALFGLMAAGIIGALDPRAGVLRLIGYAVWGISAGWGLSLALQHAGIQADPGDLSCSFAAEFPTWAPLDQWLPALFQPTGYCDDVQWQWQSLTMAEWMIVVFGLYLFVLLVVLIVDMRGRGPRRT